MVLCFEVGWMCLSDFINVVLLSSLVELDHESKFLLLGLKFSGCKFSYLKYLKSLKFWLFGLWFKMFVSRVLAFDASVSLSFLLSMFSPLFIETFSLVLLYALLDSLMSDSKIGDVWLSIFSFWHVFSINKRWPELEMLTTELFSFETWLLSWNLPSYSATMFLLLASDASFSVFSFSKSKDFLEFLVFF